MSIHLFVFDLLKGFQLVNALSYLLPDSPFYPILSKLPPPDPTNPTATTTAYVQSAVYNELPILEEIIDLIEKQEKSYMDKELERRRTRLSAGSPEQIRKEVGREIWASSRVRIDQTRVGLRLITSSSLIYILK